MRHSELQAIVSHGPKGPYESRCLGRLSYYDMGSCGVNIIVMHDVHVTYQCLSLNQENIAERDQSEFSSQDQGGKLRTFIKIKSNNFYEYFMQFTCVISRLYVF